MSLVCYECQRNMGPSETLPGREGTLVYPVVQSLVYVPVQDGISYELAYVEAPQNLAVCFKCFEEKLLENKKETLKPVYEAYNAEIDFRRVEEEQKGKWIGPSEPNLWLEAYDKFEKASENIGQGCLFCGADVKNGNPFFLAKVIDKVYSAKHLSGLFVSTNYSFSNLKEGMTAFEICFEDFRTRLPRAFEQLSYNMLGKRNPNQKIAPCEFHISPEFERALEKETGETVDDFIDKIMKDSIGKGKLRIIRKEKSEDN